MASVTDLRVAQSTQSPSRRLPPAHTQEATDWNSGREGGQCRALCEEPGSECMSRVPIAKARLHTQFAGPPFVWNRGAGGAGGQQLGCTQKPKPEDEDKDDGLPRLPPHP